MPDDLTDYDADDLIHMIEEEAWEADTPPNFRHAADAEPARKRLRFCVLVAQRVEYLCRADEQFHRDYAAYLTAPSPDKED
jgi:hypothetical protein